MLRVPPVRLFILLLPRGRIAKPPASALFQIQLSSGFFAHFGIGYEFFHPYLISSTVHPPNLQMMLLQTFHLIQMMFLLSLKKMFPLNLRKSLLLNLNMTMKSPTSNPMSLKKNLRKKYPQLCFLLLSNAMKTFSRV